MNNKETRVFPISELRLIKPKEGPTTFEGYAAVFNKLSEDLGGFREKIKPQAFKKAIKISDTRALFNHDSNFVLGRLSAKTLDIREDDKGLKFRVVPPATQWAKDLMVSVERGDISQCSFGFTLAKSGDEWSDKDGEMIRTIREVGQLLDVSLVSFPAYPDTSVALRNMEQAKTEQPPDKREIMSEMIEAFLSDNEPSDEQREQYGAVLKDMAQRFSKPMQAELEEPKAEVGEQRDGEPDSDNKPMREVADIPIKDCREFFGKA